MADIRTILESWTEATRQNKRNEIWKNHADDLVIFDVLPPMRYDRAASYRRSWEEWQPETQGDVVFALEELVVTAGHNIAFAHGFIRCGGTTLNGQTFEDPVRATFCFSKKDGKWKIQHQRVSKPYERPSG